ncbi:f9beae67-6c5f-450d-8f49-b694c0e300cf-CDS [Sclerotinia trifoliorum]|uniref:F9beae67-6c5f-450d-8f49-b694c0e300cf-CDS n=1 Tax=Sclerotinia trifoliorum TaxID=28548 RepID=A0A8H2ZST5_9HELO|nr:f9beae67-6c5f-450d-8f49-b694c0e300cf-CDS [Sclerotinia trifoliorum]
MNTPSAYTPLECLLLFQSLVAYGTDPNSFVQISQLLTNNSLVKDGETYDAGRLSAELLGDLYLRLLREELKNDAEQDVQEENGPAPSKKRKLSSPPLPTIKDAQPYREKLPILVERLYARYRDYMVRAIREDEENYRAIQRDIAAIERGDWDERILRGERAVIEQNGHRQAEDAGTKLNGITSSVLNTDEGKSQDSKPLDSRPQEPRPTEPKRLEPQLPQIKSFEIAIPPPLPQVVREQSRTKASPSPGPSPRTEGRPEGLAISDVLNSQNSTPIPPQKHITEQQPRNGTQHGAPPMAHQRSGSHGSHGPHGPSPLQSQAHSPQLGPPPLQWEPPFHPGPNPPQFHNSQPGSPHPSPHSQFYPPQFPPHTYPPHSYPSPNHRNSLPSPHLPPPHHSVPSSPLNPQYQQGVLLPPPHTMGRSPSTSGTQLDTLADIAGQQYRAASGSPMLQQGPLPPVSLPQGSMSHVPPHIPYTHSFPPPPPQRPLSSTGHPPPQWNTPFQPPYPVPNYQFNGPPPNNRPPFPRPELVALENRQYNSPYNANQSPRPSLPTNTPMQHRPQLPRPHTPLSQAPQSFMTGSGTKWTPRPSGATPRLPREPSRPQIEPLSPVLKPKVLSQSVEKSSHKRTHSKQDSAKTGKPHTPSTLRKRAGSTTSTPTTGPFRRSQSVHSHADELSLDTENSGLHFKQEVATPRGVGDVADIAADESTSRLSKVPQSPRQVMKRKRLDSPELREPRGPPLFVLWTRAFPKISVSALESISGHRNASTFANPVKERDAPGYKDLILRPQDLKSIRTAITAGHKAAAAVAAAQAAPDDQGQSSAWLPISEDLIPPKGIINYAQFEKELMRMFANAIMFNPDPDRGFGKSFENKKKESERGAVYEIDENSLVKDTRAMFMDVEKDIGALRSAERRSEEAAEREALGGPWGVRHIINHVAPDDDEVDELAGDGDAGVGNGGGSLKRRRKV